MADSTKFLEVALASNSMPLLSTLQPATSTFKDVQAQGGGVAFSGKQAGLFYAENVLPTARGLVATKPLVFANNIIAGNTADRISYSDALQVFCLNTVDGKLSKAINIFKYYQDGADCELIVYTYTPDNPNFNFQNKITSLTDFSIAANLNPELRVTKADLQGKSYICISVSYKALATDAHSSKKITKLYEVTDNTTAPATYNDITATIDLNWSNASSGDFNDVVKGIFSSFQYLIAYTENRVAWSSPTNALDFTPSDITGAGSGIPGGVEGIIKTCVSNSSGFTIYYTGGIMAAKLTSNSNFPWSFRPVNSTAGIQEVSHVSTSSPQYSLTSSGLVVSDGNSTEVLVPEIADFIASNLYERYDDATETVIVEREINPLDYAITFVSDRYIIISYKPKTQNYFDYALVYDTLLNSLGKIRVPHVSIFQLGIDTLGDFLTYEYIQTAPNDVTYEQIDTIAYQMLRKESTKQAPSMKYTIGIVGLDGTLQVVDPSLTVYNADGVAIFGKFSIKEHLATTLDYITFEDVGSDRVFSCSVQTSYKGTGIDVISSPTQLEAGGTYAKYGTRLTGRWHNVIAKGAFNLTRMSVAIRAAGYR